MPQYNRPPPHSVPCPFRFHAIFENNPTKYRGDVCFEFQRCLQWISLFCYLITDGNPRPAGCVDGGFEIGQVCYIINKFSDAFWSCIWCVMSRKAAADFKFWCKRYEIILVPVFVCVRKDKIKGAFQFFRKLMSISKACIDIFRKSGLSEIGKRLLISPFINFNSYEFAPRFAQRPCYPNRWKSGGGPNFYCFFVFVFKDEIIQDLTVRLWDVPIMPCTFTVLQEHSNFLIKSLVNLEFFTISGPNRKTQTEDQNYQEKWCVNLFYISVYYLHVIKFTSNDI